MEVPPHSAAQWESRPESVPNYMSYRPKDGAPDSYALPGAELDHSHGLSQYTDNASIASNAYAPPSSANMSAYRSYSPTSFASPISHRPSYASQHSIDPTISSVHHRNGSVSSVASHNDYSSSWSGGLSSHPGSRNNSAYSIDGSMATMGLNAPVDSSQNLYNPSSQRFPGSQNLGVDRRFSLDDRVRSNAHSASSLRSPTTTSGRSWPWGQSNLNGPARSSYDYSALGNRSLGANTIAHAPYDSMAADSPARLRSMSSSALTAGRGHQYSYAGTPSGAAAAMGLVPQQDSFLDAYGADHGLASANSDNGLMMPSVGPGGGTTRRAKFKRSRTGCLVCRKRKVKCSQDGTPCKQCRIGKRDCFYESNPPKRKKKGGKNSSSAATDESDVEKSRPFLPTAVPDAGERSAQHPGLRYDAVYGSGFNVPSFGQTQDRGVQAAADSYSQVGSTPTEEAPTFGSAGWPVPPGQAHRRPSYEPSHLSGHATSPLGPPSTAGSGASSYHQSRDVAGPNPASWYDPVAENHQHRPVTMFNGSPIAQA